MRSARIELKGESSRKKVLFHAGHAQVVSARARAASIPLVCVTFALAPATAGCAKCATIVVSAAQSGFGWTAHAAANAGGIVTIDNGTPATESTYYWV